VDTPTLTSKLMAEMGWVRELARSLVRDGSLAEDIAQDTYVIAAERQPDQTRPLRPWLARVVVNLVRTRRRGDARRAERHLRAIDADAGRAAPSGPTPAELVERLELQRALADEVLALTEPYRSTVLLHFVEGYRSSEIARRLDVPEGTVRRRLKVALEQLRAALDKRPDPKRGWIAALAILASATAPRTAHSAGAMGALVMKKVVGIVVALVLLLLALGIGIVWNRRVTNARVDVHAASKPRGGEQRNAVAASVQAAVPGWLQVPGAPQRRVAGHVVFRGAPVARAQVRIGLDVMIDMDPDAAPGAESKVLRLIAEVTTGTDGAFDFGVQPPANLTVSASAIDHAPASVAVENGNPRTRPDQLVVELGECSSRLRGSVADAAGGGIAHARVLVSGLSGTETDAAGAYKVCIAPRRTPVPTAHVRVEADGYGTIGETVIVAGDLVHDFLLVPEAILAGRVTTRSGEGVPGALVRAPPAAEIIGESNLASAWAIADRDGRFRIAGLARGSYALFAVADRARSAMVVAFARPAATSREVQLVVDSVAGARVSGQIVANGQPLDGAHVALVHDNAPAGTSISQADGSFLITDVPYGAAKIEVEGYQVAKPIELAIDLAGVENVRIEVVAMGSVHGRVTRKREPVAGANVRYGGPPAPQFGPPPASVQTDANGEFVVRGVPAGPGSLVAWDLARKAFAEPRPFEVVAGETLEVDIELDRAGEVTGTVVDDAGTALGGLYVRMDLADGTGDMCEAITDARGRFDCALLVGGKYRPSVSPEPGTRQSLAPAKGAQFALVTVPRDGVVSGITLAVRNERVAIRGVVVDDSGAPVPDARVLAIGPGASSMLPPAAMTDTEGRFTIDNLARGTYKLNARAADSSDSVLPDVTAGGPPITLTLERGGFIEGTLAGFSLTPNVMLRALAPRPPSSGVLVEGTRFTSSGLTPGRYLVEANAGAQTDVAAVDVRPGQTTKVILNARALGRVEGTVTDFATNAPVPGLRCDATVSVEGQVTGAPAVPENQALTDAAGHFAIMAPVGVARIYCFSLTPSPASPAGADVPVPVNATAKARLVSVKVSTTEVPVDVGVLFDPIALPITIAEVAANGPAATAGVRAGDLLVAIDGASLGGMMAEGAMQLLASRRPGTAAVLGVVRAGTEHTFKVTVAR